jgi:hypothetical protein
MHRILPVSSITSVATCWANSNKPVKEPVVKVRLARLPRAVPADLRDKPVRQQQAKVKPLQLQLPPRAAAVGLREVPTAAVAVTLHLRKAAAAARRLRVPSKPLSYSLPDCNPP